MVADLRIELRAPMASARILLVCSLVAALAACRTEAPRQSLKDHGAAAPAVRAPAAVAAPAPAPAAVTAPAPPPARTPGSGDGRVRPDQGSASRPVLGPVPRIPRRRQTEIVRGEALRRQRLPADRLPDLPTLSCIPSSRDAVRVLRKRKSDGDASARPRPISPRTNLNGLGYSLPPAPPERRSCSRHQPCAPYVISSDR